MLLTRVTRQFSLLQTSTLRWFGPSARAAPREPLGRAHLSTLPSLFIFLFLPPLARVASPNPRNKTKNCLSTSFSWLSNKMRVISQARPPSNFARPRLRSPIEGVLKTTNLKLIFAQTHDKRKKRLTRWASTCPRCQANWQGRTQRAK